MRRKGQYCLAHDRDPSTQDNLLAYYKPRELKKTLRQKMVSAATTTIDPRSQGKKNVPVKIGQTQGDVIQGSIQPMETRNGINRGGVLRPAS